jgi:hypothetical protein
MKWTGRPPVHTEAYTKTSVVLLNRQIVYLDQLSARIRSASGAVLKRAVIIRGLIDALEESGKTLLDVRSESDLKKLLLRR